MKLKYLSINRDLVWWKMQGYVGLFRNRKEVIPGRWGFYFLGIEVGSRNAGDKVGTWLKEHGLWPW